MSAVLDFNQRLTTETCYKCGIVFAVPQYFRKTRQDDKQSFWCPNGHPQAYVESEADRLRKELEKEKRNTEWWRVHAESKDKTIKGQNIQLGKVRAKLHRTEVRASHGVCPCCNRSFVNMQRHMKTKHPDYVKEHSPDEHTR